MTSQVKKTTATEHQNRVRPADRSRSGRASAAPHLAPELKALVSRSVALLGSVIKRELGPKSLQLIEDIRKRMASLRDKSPAAAFEALTLTYRELEALSSNDRLAVAASFALMLELMNACENAYRSHRLASRSSQDALPRMAPEAIIYVLTAHPTEARAPQNIAVFQDIERILERILKKTTEGRALAMDAIIENDLMNLLEVAWRAPIVRMKAPEVRDEADHIYTTALREDVLPALIDLSESKVPFYLRSWVGGDKDGHPGVDEKTLLQSLTFSRGKLLSFCLARLMEVEETLALLPRSVMRSRSTPIKRKFQALRHLRAGDAAKIRTLRTELGSFGREYLKVFGALHPSLRALRRILRMFPALVVPLELRESSDVLMEGEPLAPGAKPHRLAIDRMLETVARLSKGGDPRWYARGFIISMTESLDHILAAAAKQERAFGAIRLPVIPLFEQATALERSEEIVREMISDRRIVEAARRHWDGFIEIMVGYSDSAKEAGVLPSRLAIAKMLPRLERACEAAGLTPLFFHGSGGSIDRGGGSIEDQTAWWPRAALKHYKVTVQGEMVERSLATPAIARRTVEQIIESAGRGLTLREPVSDNAALDSFARKISSSYRERIHDPEFLEIVAQATPYSYLKYLKIGSRPVKRSKQLTVSGLRAIPWVLCWTQTRVLFPTWWGIGSAWMNSSPSDKRALRHAFKTEPVFTSFVKALGFTLAKVELPVWRLYLERSRLPREFIASAFAQFDEEYARTVMFFHEVTGRRELLWFRPWLGESIRLRSPMIHPLNVLQILAERDKDVQLLRVCVTGISSGMLTTG